MEKFSNKDNGDIIPKGTFEADFTAETMSGIAMSALLGAEIKVAFPTIAHDYQNGFTLEQIVDKYNLRDRTTLSVARAAVRLALFGYEGDYDFVTCDQYSGLMSKDEYIQSAKDHRSAAAKKQMDEGRTIHGQTLEEKKLLGRLGVLAQGSMPYEPEEMKLIKDLSLQPEFQRKTRINAQKISDHLNTTLHEGKQVRTPTQIKKMFYQLKKREGE